MSYIIPLFILNKGCCLFPEHTHQVMMLRPCIHRICITCVRNLIARTCPMCRSPIDTYLPPHMMGGEHWEDSVPEQLQRDFTMELLGQLGFNV